MENERSLLQPLFIRPCARPLPRIGARIRLWAARDGLEYQDHLNRR